MATTFRQDLSRFDFIEAGDSVTFQTHVTRRRPTKDECRARREAARLKWNATHGPSKQRGPDDYFYLASESDPVRIEDLSTWYYPTAKALEPAADGWIVKEKDHRGDPVVVTRDNFWALRKAPGKGALAQFDPTDSVVICQVCDQPYLGNTGRLPHHGYQRPGWGEQTPSCSGALELAFSVVRTPFQKVADPERRVAEVSRALVLALIESLDRGIVANDERLAMLRAGGPDEFPGIDKFTKVSRYCPEDAPTRQPIKRGTKGRDYRNDFESHLRYEIGNAEDRAENLRMRRKTEQARFDAWLPGGEGVLTAPPVRDDAQWTMRR